MLCGEMRAEEELVSVTLCGSRLSEGLYFDPMNLFSHVTTILLLLEPEITSQRRWQKWPQASLSHQLFAFCISDAWDRGLPRCMRP